MKLRDIKVANSDGSTLAVNLRTAIEHVLIDQCVETSDPENMELPKSWFSESDGEVLLDWAKVDTFLGTLSDEDLETLCTGDSDDHWEIARKAGNEEQAKHIEYAMEALFHVVVDPIEAE